MQLSDLVEAKTSFINRTELFGKRTESDHFGPYIIGDYYGVPAFLSESVSDNFTPLLFKYLFSNNRTWILGASYDRIGKFDAEDKSKCGRESCYRQSLKEKKICTPGKPLFSKFKMSYV